MFDNKSDYALNKKDQDSIVYSGSDGNIARITRADFSSEEEFLFWKSWSDADYKETGYADSYFHRHTVGLDTIGDNAGNIPSPEEVLLYKTEREEQVQEGREGCPYRKACPRTEGIPQRQCGLFVGFPCYTPSAQAHIYNKSHICFRRS